MRYHGFDLIRIVSFAAIVWWHYAYALWVGQVSRNPLATESWVWHTTGQMSLFLAFSGFSIIVLSSFLTGLVGRKARQWQFIGFFCLGWLLFATTSRLTYGAWFFEWDIYPFLIISFLSLQGLRFLQGAWLLGLAALGVVISFIPFWQLEFFNALPPLAKAVLVGSSQGSALGQWPVLPFIGLVWCFYGLGRWLKEYLQPRELDLLDEGLPANPSLASVQPSLASVQPSLASARAGVLLRRGLIFLPWHRFELVFWLPVLGAGVFCLGAFMGERIDVHLDAKLYRLSPYQLWGQLVWVVFLMRLSMLQGVQNWLAELKVPCFRLVGFKLVDIYPVRAVGRLRMSTNFWAIYVVHYLVIFLFVFLVGDVIRSSVWGSFGLMVLVPITSEVLVWGLLNLRLALSGD